MTSIKLMIMQKPQAHLQTMTKEPAMFQIDRYQTVEGVAHTRYPRECTLIVFKPKKLLSSKVVKKVTKIKLSIVPKSHVYLLYMTTKAYKVSNGLL